MTTSNKYNQFDPLKVALTGSNLIEASAGTGKTYSVGLLVLRLLLEKKISLSKILMVTFTTAAVAELELGIRKSIRLAFKASKGERIDEKAIEEIVTTSIDDLGQKDTQVIIQNALHMLDELKVMTIHSFCQKTINEFSLQTKQFFNPELVTDDTEILEPLILDFWRIHITSLPVQFLRTTDFNNFKTEIEELIKNHFSGKRYNEYDAEKTYSAESVKTEINQYFLALQEIETIVLENTSQLQKDCNDNTYARKNNSVALLYDISELTKTLRMSKPPNFIVEIFGPYDLIQKVKNLDDLLSNAKCQIFYFAIQEITSKLEELKSRKNIITYYDLIQRMHQSLKDENHETLRRLLSEKYEAVFIDEFQDTDSKQYEIFKWAFFSRSILFFIGDPKQSIYGWRSADLATYFKAAGDVDNIYSMNINYRSSENFIQSLNSFFLPNETFDTFNFQGERDSIPYHPVQSPKPNGAGNFLFGEQSAENIYLITEDAVDRNLGIAFQISELLSDDRHQIVKNGKARKILPSDIAVLVRLNYMAKPIKKSLSQLGIPAVTYKDEKIFSSPEAIEISYILEAILDNSKRNVVRALVTTIAQFAENEIQNLNFEKIADAFRNYNSIWKDQGIYAAMISFIHDFDVKNKLIENEIIERERILTNTYHLIEVLNKQQHLRNFSAVDLIQWLKSNIEKKLADGDEYNQRLESEEEAVKIVTIHKSKGLQYPIIFVPTFSKKTPKGIITYQQPETGEFISVESKQASDEILNLHAKQEEQENRRLIYVALTRGIYACYIHLEKKEDWFSPFIKAIDWEKGHIAQKSELKNGIAYKSNTTESPLRAKSEVHFSLQDNHWKQLSYTYLSLTSDRKKRSAGSRFGSEYDEFIFKQLSLGKTTGNFLHLLFEQLVFDQPQTWGRVINKAVDRIAPEKRALFTTGITHLIDHVMHAEINTGKEVFTLSEIAHQNKIHELEFNFPIGYFNPSDLNNIEFLDQKLQTRFDETFTGLMNGKIDLVFYLKEKYYILDWKSTFLGTSLSDYNDESLLEAMDAENYHLQYFIYTVALKKYLESRLKNFDYEKDFGGVLYCFVRGMRKEKTGGIYFHRPSYAQITQLEEMLTGADLQH